MINISEFMDPALHVLSASLGRKGHPSSAEGPLELTLCGGQETTIIKTWAHHLYHTCTLVL